MKNTFFCSDNARQIGEKLIGSAINIETYILIECPGPWISEAFNSKWVPDNLRVLVEDCKEEKLPIKFMLIANNLSHKVDQTTLIIYQQIKGLTTGYHKQELKLTNIEQVAGVLKRWLRSGIGDDQTLTNTTRDILVCTHGSRDMCCARYGNPFYAQAQATITDLGLDNVRIWKSTHFGGHRFAPTIIDLPEARYYGNLDKESFQSILTRTGDIQCLEKVYRGWGVLSPSLQVLEKKLLLSDGWDWYKNKVEGRIISQNLQENTTLAELSYETPDNCLCSYRAKIVEDKTNSAQLKGSCHAAQASTFAKYTVANLQQSPKKLVCIMDA